MVLGVKRINYRLISLVSGVWLVISSGFDYPAFAQHLTPNLSVQAERGERLSPVSLFSIRENIPPSVQAQRGARGVRSVCPQLDMETLITNMLRDIPGYANRVSQRARRWDRKGQISSYVIVAGRPEFQPLPLNHGSSVPQASATNDDVKQIFFTTLERQYTAGKMVQLQQFHWLFLTKTPTNSNSSEWQFVLMFSQTGLSSTNPTNQPPTPPRDSSNGIIAQAIKAWLRDCNAGSVRINIRDSPTGK
jgi:hypothetical protein